MAPPIRDVSVQGFAEIYGTTSQRIYQLVQDGMPHRKRGPKTTRIVPREALRWLRERDREQAGTVDDGKLNVVTAQARKLIAEAELKELEVGKVRGELVPADIIAEFIGNFIGGFASVAAGQLGRFERDMVKVSSPAEARELRQKIHASLMEGAQRQAEQMDSDASAIEDLLAGASAGDPTGDELNDEDEEADDRAVD